VGGGVRERLQRAASDGGKGCGLEKPASGSGSGDAGEVGVRAGGVAVPGAASAAASGSNAAEAGVGAGEAVMSFAALGAASGSDAGGVRERGLEGSIKERGVPFIFPRRLLIAAGSFQKRGVFVSGGLPASSPFFLGAVLLFPLSTLLFPALSTLLRYFPRPPILPRVL
jgi:hypothetical protein